MGYAIKPNGSWRAVLPDWQLEQDETYSDAVPALLVQETTLSPSQQIILADGLDVAIVNIMGQPDALINYTVNGEAQSLTLNASGKDALELTCDTPNTTLLVQAGTAKAVIFAVEVPS